MTKTKKKIIIYFILAAFLSLVAFAVYWVEYLHIAHSTFQNYYDFRGCVQLLERTDTYGICKTSSGQTIKIVLYDGRWFLDGDLPGQGF